MNVGNTDVSLRAKNGFSSCISFLQDFRESLVSLARSVWRRGFGEGDREISELMRLYHKEKKHMTKEYYVSYYISVSGKDIVSDEPPGLWAIGSNTNHM